MVDHWVTSCLSIIGVLLCVSLVVDGFYFLNPKFSDQIISLSSVITDNIPLTVNRLLVQGIDGNIYTINPDGTDRLALTEDASSSATHLVIFWATYCLG